MAVRSYGAGGDDCAIDGKCSSGATGTELQSDCDFRACPCEGR